MVSSLNKVTLIGHLGKDPEVRVGPDGAKIVTFSLATSESWKDKASGERRDRTEWHRVVIFNERLGDVVERYVKKGSRLYLEGQLQTRRWTDQTGQERFTTEIVLSRFRGELMMMDSKGSAGATDEGGYFEPAGYGSGSGSLGGGSGSGGGSGGGSRPFDDLDDEVPF